jgi:hypothetical protein
MWQFYYSNGKEDEYNISSKIDVLYNCDYDKDNAVE